MTINIAINGYGRVGRCILRALYEYQKYDNLKIVAINDLGDHQAIAHLTRHDTTHGPFHAEVALTGAFQHHIHPQLTPGQGGRIGGQTPECRGQKSHHFGTGHWGRCHRGL